MAAPATKNILTYFLGIVVILLGAINIGLLNRMHCTPSVVGAASVPEIRPCGGLKSTGRCPTEDTLHTNKSIKTSESWDGHSWDVDTWYKRYEEHYNSLIDKKGDAKLLIYESGTWHGLGNKFPALISGLMLAMLTDRIFMVAWHDSTFHFHEVFKPTVFIDQDVIRSRFKTASSKTMKIHLEDHSTNNIISDVSSKDLKEHWKEYDIVRYESNDWPMPLFTLNPNYATTVFQKTHGLKLFHDLGRKIMVLNPELRETSDMFRDNMFRRLNIGIQIRTKKDFVGLKAPEFRTFFDVAKMIQQRRLVPDNETAFFLTCDSPERILPEAQSYFGTDNVWMSDWSPRRTKKGDTMAVVDIDLLAQMDELVITQGSSFGQIAAALGDIIPHSVGYPGDIFWKGTLSEPCMWNVRQSLKVDHIRDNRPAEFLHHMLCHPDTAVGGD